MRSRTEAVAQGPHSHYHGLLSVPWREPTRAKRFFEGWYFRLTLPEAAESVAFMYSIDDPLGGADHSGGAAQILGPGHDYIARSFPKVSQFWAWSDQLGLGHYRSRSEKSTGFLPFDTFEKRLVNSGAGPIADDNALGSFEAYQVTATVHQGCLRGATGEVLAAWSYSVAPRVGWGGVQPRATAGWLSYLPISEPGWQVIMPHGLASGWLRWRGQTYRFQDAPTYAEKNWGGAFPSKWFWLQCNAFPDLPELSITAAGGLRTIFGRQQAVGLIGLHWGDRFFEFPSVRCDMRWTVSPWGHWQLNARNGRYQIEVTGRAEDDGAMVRVPTLNGLQWDCRDTTRGHLVVKLWEWQEGKYHLLLSATSEQGGLEVGGSPWLENWVFESGE